MNLWLTLSKAISIWADREAIVDHDKRFTYKAFGHRVANLATALSEMGLKKGSVVAIAAPNCHQYMEVYYACGILGIILVPLNYRLAAAELADICSDAGAELLFIHGEFAGLFDELSGSCKSIKSTIWIDGDAGGRNGTRHSMYESVVAGSGKFPALPDLGADDLAHLYYTSGTTGRPKGVMLSHGNVSFNALGAIAELTLKDTDTWIHAAPLFHLADAWAIFAMTWVGAKHVFMPHFNSTDVLRLVQKEKVSVTVFVPTMLNAILNDPRLAEFDKSSLRLILTGGSPIAPEKVKEVHTLLGCQYVQLYGMTETSPFLTLSIPRFDQLDKSESEQIEVRCRTGRAYIGAEVKVVKPDGEEVQWNNLEVGEIIARGPTITKGYWKQPEATADAIRNGWIYTGDLAVVDSHGYINIVDRKKDMIITGGENVFSTEVEYALYEHPAVLECAVFGIPDERWGEAVKAVVVKRPGNENVTSEQIIEFVRTRLAHYKAPRSVDFLAELPKTGSGKIYKKGLRETYWEGYVKQVN